MSRNLFVYGTLRRNATNRHAALLHRAARFLGEAKMRGRLYRIAHYPGLVCSNGGDDWVCGDVYQLRAPAAMFRALDEYEGCGPGNPLPQEFRREVRPVLLDSGEWIRAYVYSYAGDVADKRRIPSGEYVL